jgi:hypothetical protein
MTKSVAGLFVAVALALTVTAAGAAEDNYSANSRLTGCRDFLDQKSNGDGFARGLCVGVVTTIVDIGGLFVVSPLDDKSRRALCIDAPAAVTGGQAIRVVVAYIEARPARMHEPFPVLALEALQAAWPCR